MGLLAQAFLPKLCVQAEEALTMMSKLFFVFCISLFVTSCKQSQADVVMQTVSLDWKGVTYSRDYLCTRTFFPEARWGAGDVFSGATGAKGKRNDIFGMSPTPQWMAIKTTEDDVLIRLTCHDQWLKGQHILSGKAAIETSGVPITLEAASDVYVKSALGKHIGIIPVSNPSIQMTGPERVPNMDEALKATRTQIEELRDFSELLNVFENPSKADPELLRVTKSLPTTDKRTYPSKPWFMKCKGDLDMSGLKEGRVYTRKGQALFESIPRMNRCKFTKFYNNNAKGDPAIKSPYLETKFGVKDRTSLHLLDESGRSTFIEVDRMLLRDPELLLHIPQKTGNSGPSRDPFLDGEIYQKGIRSAVEAFDVHKSKNEGD